MACRFQISLSADFCYPGVTGGQIEVNVYRCSISWWWQLLW